ncbi:hypothetical protein COCVIDRAFT_19300 [Bipolaris victoriae FI3]|uniref:Uncharacterized protein n=1 Tax=Bipolaris victoriae (strain FI3) TaxID=930091 RepID=W7DYG8_BIPV3|nr:hypothetical protein COCVIDRAFT_19300 [Bipolaris victoriae FI3]
MDCGAVQAMAFQSEHVHTWFAYSVVHGGEGQRKPRQAMGCQNREWVKPLGVAIGQWCAARRRSHWRWAEQWGWAPALVMDPIQTTCQPHKTWLEPLHGDRGRAKRGEGRGERWGGRQRYPMAASSHASPLRKYLSISMASSSVAEAALLCHVAASAVCYQIGSQTPWSGSRVSAPPPCTRACRGWLRSAETQMQMESSGPCRATTDASLSFLESMSDIPQKPRAAHFARQRRNQR